MLRAGGSETDGVARPAPAVVALLALLAAAGTTVTEVFDSTVEVVRPVPAPMMEVIFAPYGKPVANGPEGRGGRFPLPVGNGRGGPEYRLGWKEPEGLSVIFLYEPDVARKSA